MTEKSINIKKLLRFSGKNKTIKPVPSTKGHDYVGVLVGLTFEVSVIC